ncbi:MAG: hypothetical protein KGZ65_04185 [Sphingomonadales bacterium]|nr:hypothetical protein [Sphingomonadaceae bacterium]MBS3930412.1 hypothetical protein [Sphingomonadales bacterium]
MKTIDIEEAEKNKIGAADLRALCTEAYVDLSVGTDDDLRKLRDMMIKKHGKVLKGFSDLGDQRYSSPEGNEYMRDMNYYNELIRRIENEMSYRMITL